VSGGASRLAAIDARNQLFKMAAGKLEASPDDLEIVDKQIRVKGTPAKTIALATVATDAHNVHRRSDWPRLLRQPGIGGRGKSPRQLAAVHHARLHRRSRYHDRQRENFKIRRRARHRPADPSSRRRRARSKAPRQ
jgi:CO/xanthine dehydrogenase Mo-binding subunit